MTALRIDDEHLNLVCDGCGTSIKGISSTARNWDAVWAVLAGAGWSGRQLPIGPHRCPPCGVAVPDAAGGGLTI